MPSTKHRLNDDSVRQALPTRRDEEMELARVYLELNSRLQPTWGRSVEPDAYTTYLDGEILVSRDGVDDKLPVGTVSAHSVHLGEADEDGVPWFDVLDAHSGDTAMYTELLKSDRSCYSEWVESTLEPFGGDLFILDRIRIKPEYRGNGYGLYAAQLMITGFASDGVLACVPAPYELIENPPPRDPATRPRNRGNQIPGWTAAEAKLRKHCSLLGFERVPSSDVFALSLNTRRPSMETVMRKYLAGKHKRRSNARSLPDEPLVCWDGLLSTAGTLSDNRSMQEPITRDPELMHGTPVFRGTRVPVETMFEYLENGESLDDFLEGFPTVSRELAVQVLEESKELRLARVS